MLQCLKSKNMFTKLQNLILCDYYKLIQRITSGSFAEIYLACNKNNLNEKYAAKVVKFGTKSSQLHFEARIYEHLKDVDDILGLPQFIGLANQKCYNIMLMELLGPSIEDIFVRKQRKMQLKQVLMIGYQMVERIKSLHQKQIIHRDVKPENFLMGVGDKSDILYIIDFSLSKRFIKNSKHVPYREGKQVNGTLRYASINNQKGYEQSRRDDIQSIGYAIMYLLRGSLPWQNLKYGNYQAKYQSILKKKIQTSEEELCKGYPKQLISFIKYAKNLQFQQKPNYEYLLNLLEAALQSEQQKINILFAQSEEQEEKYNQQKMIKIQCSQPRQNNIFAIKNNQNLKKFPQQKVIQNPKSQIVAVKQEEKLPPVKINERKNINQNNNYKMNLNKKEMEMEMSNAFPRHKSKTVEYQKIPNTTTISNGNLMNNLYINNIRSRFLSNYNKINKEKFKAPLRII